MSQLPQPKYSTELRKYPRTPHLEGSRAQPGDDDEDLLDIPYSSLAGQFVVIEEKLDGANAGISFDEAGNLQLQSRGHFLTGGGREVHFDLFKSWAQTHQKALFDRLGSRFLLFGEWMYAKHTVFYDNLPHYFLEFDILDRKEDFFLSTSARQAMLQGLPVTSVPVLSRGIAPNQNQLDSMIKESLYKSAQWRPRLTEVVERLGFALERVLAETDDSPLAEGLYLKVEAQGQVKTRYKYVRSSFLARVKDSDSHWLSRPIVPNQLADGVDIFACERV